MATSLVEQGFKVARIEQTETPEMMADRTRGKKLSKFDKVIRREICQITTKGTYVYDTQLVDSKTSHSYMLAVTEKVSLKFDALNLDYVEMFQYLDHGCYRFGVCFVDTSIGIFHMAEFDDDNTCSRLLALFSECPPSVVSVHSNLIEFVCFIVIHFMNCAIFPDFGCSL